MKWLNKAANVIDRIADKIDVKEPADKNGRKELEAKVLVGDFDVIEVDRDVLRQLGLSHALVEVLDDDDSGKPDWRYLVRCVIRHELQLVLGLGDGVHDRALHAVCDVDCGGSVRASLDGLDDGRLVGNWVLEGNESGVGILDCAVCVNVPDELQEVGGRHGVEVHSDLLVDPLPLEQLEIHGADQVAGVQVLGLHRRDGDCLGVNGLHYFDEINYKIRADRIEKYGGLEH